MLLPMRFLKQRVMRSVNWLLVMLLILPLTLTACMPTEPTPPNYYFDDLGRLVAINGTPQRIISLAPSNTEILFALGLGGKVVGVTDWCDYPPEALNKTKVGGYINPDIEAILALNPDLVLVAHGTPMGIINSMIEAGLTVFGIKTTDLNDLVNDIRRIAEITDKEIEAQALTAQMVNQIEAVTNITSGLEQRPKVFYLVWYDPLFTVGSGEFIHELIEKAGGVNIFGNLTGWPVVSLEEILARDPEIIITSQWAYGWALNSTELASTNASQEGRIYTCDDNLVQRPGPRLPKGLQWFAHFIHPELFEEPES